MRNNEDRKDIWGGSPPPEGVLNRNLARAMKEGMSERKIEMLLDAGADPWAETESGTAISQVGSWAERASKTGIKKDAGIWTLTEKMLKKGDGNRRTSAPLRMFLMMDKGDALKAKEMGIDFELTGEKAALCESMGELVWGFLRATNAADKLAQSEDFLEWKMGEAAALNANVLNGKNGRPLPHMLADVFLSPREGKTREKEKDERNRLFEAAMRGLEKESGADIWSMRDENGDTVAHLLCRMREVCPELMEKAAGESSERRVNWWGETYEDILADNAELSETEKREMLAAAERAELKETPERGRLKERRKI